MRLPQKPKILKSKSVELQTDTLKNKQGSAQYPHCLKICSKFLRGWPFPFHSLNIVSLTFMDPSTLLVKIRLVLILIAFSEMWCSPMLNLGAVKSPTQGVSSSPNSVGVGHSAAGWLSARFATPPTPAKEFWLSTFRVGLLGVSTGWPWASCQSSGGVSDGTSKTLSPPKAKLSLSSTVEAGEAWGKTSCRTGLGNGRISGFSWIHSSNAWALTIKPYNIHNKQRPCIIILFIIYNL